MFSHNKVIDADTNTKNQKNSSASVNAEKKIILVVEDDQDLRDAVCDTLELADYHAVAVSSGESALEVLKHNNEIAMIVSDVNMGGMDGHALLQEVQNLYPHIPMLLVTAYGSVNQSVDAMRQGAVDYLVKPFASQVLVDAINRYVGVGQKGNCDEPIAVAASSIKLLQLAKRVAQTESTVLIVGESGIGKEVLARYIHRQSERADQPFIAINCAAIPENMLEAILFGHEKGAFTGAYSSAPGKFEQANGGTILLDEISEMEIGLQAKLLRVLQEREVERVGGRKTIALDVRVIATSNRNLQQSVADGLFREDLYYRLSVLPLQWAPLRERPDDIVPLATQLLSRHAHKQHRAGVSLSEQAKIALLSYPWPGNVRELDNVMQRALILQGGNSMDANDLGLQLNGTEATINTQGSVNNISELSGQNQTSFASGLATPVSSGGSEIGFGEEGGNDHLLGKDLKQREFEIIVQALQAEGGSRKNTAERLGISARTLRYKIAKLKEHGLNVNTVWASHR
ncbi:sigma-54-dependent transcriptional regulator [Aurantivibrio infirmus]